MSEYNDMSSAPKDGTVVEVEAPSGGYPASGSYRWGKTSLGDGMWQSVDKPTLFVWIAPQGEHRWRLPDGAAGRVQPAQTPPEQKPGPGLWQSLVARATTLMRSATGSSGHG